MWKRNFTEDPFLPFAGSYFTADFAALNRMGFREIFLENKQLPQGNPDSKVWLPVIILTCF